MNRPFEIYLKSIIAKEQKKKKWKLPRTKQHQ